jgi:hypothetical protein
MTQQLTTLYELYKSLPEKDRYKFKKIIVNEPEPVPIAQQIREGLREIKAIREGRAKSVPARQFLDELKKELAND